MDNVISAEAEDIKQNLKKVMARIAEAAERCGRDPGDIRLIAVSKTKPYGSVIEALECGVADFGENRPRELEQKFFDVAECMKFKDNEKNDKKEKNSIRGKAPSFNVSVVDCSTTEKSKVELAALRGGGHLAFSYKYEQNTIRWHQIGQLQKNKVKYIIDKASLIHSVESISLAEEINRRAAAIGKQQEILIQVNISGEETKSGVSPENAAKLCEEISALENVRIKGLMTISVKGYTHDQNKRLFLRLKELASNIEIKNIPNVEMKELSMGMSHDFEAAIEAGATMLRIGSLIFGKRDYPIEPKAVEAD